MRSHYLLNFFFSLPLCFFLLLLLIKEDLMLLGKPLIFGLKKHLVDVLHIELNIIQFEHLWLLRIWTLVLLSLHIINHKSQFFTSFLLFLEVFLKAHFFIFGVVFILVDSLKVVKFVENLSKFPKLIIISYLYNLSISLLLKNSLEKIRWCLSQGWSIDIL